MDLFVPMYWCTILNEMGLITRNSRNLINTMRYIQINIVIHKIRYNLFDINRNSFQKCE